MLFIIKSAITLALLYSCFFIFLSKETFHRFNRIMLLGIMLASLVVPLFQFTTEHPTVINEEFHQLQTFIEEPAPIMSPVVVEEAKPRITWVQALTWTYLAGVIVMAVITIVQAISLIRFMRGGLRHTDSRGNTVILQRGELPPFSIFRYIVMSVKDYENNCQHILTHEQEHIRLGHTYDLLLLEAMKLFQWFNPFVWFISRDLKTLHEYEADQAVINQGIDAKSYQQLLVMKVVGNRLQPFTNNLNHGSLKKRILMMYQKPSNRWLMLKALCAIPVVALALNTFATPVPVKSVEEVVAELEKKEIPLFEKTEKSAVPIVAESSVSLVEEKVAPVAAADEEGFENGNAFAIYPVVDQYGRVTGLSHGGEPAEQMKSFLCTKDYVFINGRQATEEELKNYKYFNIGSFNLLKTAEGTKEYDYKDKKGVIVLRLNPVIAVNRNIVSVSLDKDTIDEKTLAKALAISEEEIEALNVYQGAPATELYGPYGINGVIEVKTSGNLRVEPGTIVTGVVLVNTEARTPIANAIVSEVTKDGKVVTSTFTDEDGRYQIRIFEPENKLCAQADGYYKSGLYSIFTKYMSPIALIENQSLEELVKRIPDAQVDKDGTVTVNGKKVKRITVDGNEVYKEQSSLPELVEKIPNAHIGADGTVTVDGKEVKRIAVDGNEVYNNPGKNKPLIVLNLKEVAVLFDGDVKSLEDQEVLCKLLSIKEEDIESITILKDAAAIAIWGYKGKNGVIEVKTKNSAQNASAKVAEVSNKDDNEVFLAPEEVAEFPGGNAALMQFLAKNIRYPQAALENGVQGRVIMQFIVNTDGSCSDFKIIRNTAAASSEKPIGAAKLTKARARLEKEALRVLRAMPYWKPAKHQGKAVPMQYTLPVVFRLP
ncbi:MAG: energy transducer TonB [Bacteroidaceae bacterium]|nr:energy transducer TonB [Bacteroidaceae bacterium]